MNSLRGNKLDAISTRNQVMRGRRVTDAAPSVDSTDYIIQQELTDKVTELEARLQANLDNVTQALVHGSMWVDDAAIVVNTSGAGINVEVAVGAGLSVGMLRSMTFANSILTVTAAGLYLVNWSMSVYPSNNNEIVSGQIMINNTPSHVTEGSVEVINSGKPNCIAGSGLLQLLPKDQIKLCLKNETAAHNITLTHASVTALKVD